MNVPRERALSDRKHRTRSAKTRERESRRLRKNSRIKQITREFPVYTCLDAEPPVLDLGEPLNRKMSGVRRAANRFYSRVKFLDSFFLKMQRHARSWPGDNYKMFTSGGKADMTNVANLE